MYATENFPTKKALKDAVKLASEGKRRPVGCFQPGGIFPGTTNGEDTIEGPHGYHRWYARVKIENGNIVKVIG